MSAFSRKSDNPNPKLSLSVAEHYHAEAIARGADCKHCPLYGMRVGPIPSTVVRNARLTIIGEAPGKMEILNGQNFIGPSGRILDQSLARGGVERKDCTVTNTIACRPPDDYVAYMYKLKLDYDRKRRDFDEGRSTEDPGPFVHPAQACAPRLARDIEESKAPVILAVGAQALKACAEYLKLPYGKRKKGQGTAVVVKSIKDQHGSPIQLPDGRILCASYHPAFAMRPAGRAYMPVVKADLARAARISSRGYIDWKPPKAILFPTVEQVEEVCNRFVEAGVTVVTDLETDGKDPRKCNIRCVGLGANIDGEEVIIVVPFRHRQGGAEWWPDTDTKMRVVRALRRVFSSCKIAGHNVVQFDSTLLIRFGLIRDRMMAILDTMLAHKNTDQCDLPHKLEFVSTRFLETPAWKIGHDDKVDPDSGTNVGTDEELHFYNAVDTCNTLRILPLLLDRLAALGAMHQFEIDTELAPIFRDMGDLGLNIDVRRRRNLAKILRDELKIRRQEVVDVLLDSSYFASGKIPQEILDFVQNGPPKKPKPVKLTKKGKPSKAKPSKSVVDGFNPNTYSHVAYFLYQIKGLVPKLNNKGREFKEGDKKLTGAGALIHLLSLGVDPQTRDFIDALLVYRAYDKLSGTYVGRIAKRDIVKNGKTIKEGELYGGFPSDTETWNIDGKPYDLQILHTTYQLQVIASGRVSTKPAIQNWPERAREAVCFECLGDPTDATTPSFGQCSKCEKDAKKADPNFTGEVQHCKICHARMCSACKGKGKAYDKKTDSYDETKTCKACRGDGKSRAPLNMRSMVVAPPGHVFVGADFDQLELRIYAAVSEDQLILDVLADGRDPHMWNYACLEANTIEEAWAIYRKYEAMGGKNNKKVKQLRNIAKRFVFLMIYGGEKEKLFSVMSQERDKATGELSFPEVTDKDCRRWHKNWTNLHPWMEAWQNAMKRHAEVYGFAASLVDERKRFFPGGTAKQNAPVNHPIQSEPKSSMILTDYGYIPIGELLGNETGKKAYVKNDEWAQFAVIPEGDAPIYKVRTSNGRETEWSKDHRVRRATSKGLEWVAVCDLRLGDLIATQASRPLEYGTAMDTEDAYWSGYSIGNRGYSNQSWTITIGHRWHAPLYQQVDRCVAWAESHGIKTQVRWRRKDEVETSVVRGELCDKAEATHAVVTLYGALSTIGAEIGLHSGDTAHTKRVPAKIWASNLAARKAFFLGFLQADGYTKHPDEDKGEVATIINPCQLDLLKDLQLLGHTIGISGTISGPYEADRNGHEAYRLRLPGHQVFSALGLGRSCRTRGGELAPRFEAEKLLQRTSKEVCGAYEAAGRSRGSAIVLYSRVKKGGDVSLQQLELLGVKPDYDYVRVVSVEDTGTVEPVFTLSVDHPDHSYVAESIISKNSTGADFANRAIIEIARQIRHREWSPLSGLILQVHDMVGVCVPIAREKEAMKIVEKAMNFVLMGVPITATATSGYCWMDI